MSSTKSKVCIISLACAILVIALACSCISVSKAHGAQGFEKLDKPTIGNADSGTETLSFTVNTHGKTLANLYGDEPMTDGMVIEYPKSNYEYALLFLYDDVNEGITFAIAGCQGGSYLGVFDAWYQADTFGGYFSGAFLNGRAMPFNVLVDCPEGMNEVELFWTETPCPLSETDIPTSFDPNGGIWTNNFLNSPTFINEHYFTETVFPADPTKGNKTFLGWFDAEGNELGPDFIRFWDPNYTAKWGVTISYDANGGSGEIDPQTCVENDTLTLSNGNEFSKDDAALLGWNTNPDGSGDEYSLGQEITATDSLTLYAQWSKAPGPEPTPTPGEDVNATPQTGDCSPLVPFALLAVLAAGALLYNRKGSYR